VSATARPAPASTASMRQTEKTRCIAATLLAAGRGLKKTAGASE
jgi:hypothetical protein